MDINLNLSVSNPPLKMKRKEKKKKPNDFKLTQFYKNQFKLKFIFKKMLIFFYH